MRKRKRQSKPGSDLVDAMIRIRDEVVENADATEEIRRRIIAIGSATEDNINCVEHIEIGQTKSTAGPVLERGIKIKGKNIMLSDIVSYIEDAPIPESVRERFPRLSAEEWCASLRFVTLLLHSLQSNTWEVGEE